MLPVCVGPLACACSVLARRERPESSVSRGHVPRSVLQVCKLPYPALSCLVWGSHRTDGCAKCHRHCICRRLSIDGHS